MLEKSQDSVEETVDRSFKPVADESPPREEIISEKDWRAVASYLGGYLIDTDKENELLSEIEKHGARLILSPDQKRVRPGIGLKLLEGLGVDLPRDQKIQLMSAPEGIHVYTKGIDDIEDGDLERNELPTLHHYLASYIEDQIGDDSELDKNPGELAEDLAMNFFLAVKSRNYRIISDLDENYFSAEDKEDFRVAIEDIEEALSDGQNLDLAGTLIGRGSMMPNYLGGDIDVMEYTHDTNRGKTARLFSLLGRFAQISSDYEGEELEKWGLYGGEAFQIKDDVLDIRHGRNSDLVSNNYTVPIYIAERYLHTHPDEELNEKGEELSRILRKQDPSEQELGYANELIVEETPALDAAENLAGYLTGRANNYLDEVDWVDERYMHEIETMTEFFGYGREK